MDIRSGSLPNQTIKLRTNLFAWPYSWLDIEIMITGWGGQKFLANNIQTNRFVPTRYFLDDRDDINVIIQFLTSIKPMKREDQPDQTKSFQDFINQFLEFLRYARVTRYIQYILHDRLMCPAWFKKIILKTNLL